MNNVGCTEEWNIHAIYNTYIVPSIAMIAAISIIPPVYIYVRAYIKGELESTKLLFYCGIFFFATIFSHYTWIIIANPEPCLDGQIWVIFWDIATYLYTFQGLLLTAILFLRIIRIFDDTPYYPHKCTIVAFFSYIGIALAMGIIGNIIAWNSSADSDSSSFGLLLLGASAFMYVLEVIWLNALCIYKIIKVYSGSTATEVHYERNNAELVRFITKISVLCFVSTSNIVLFLICFFLRDSIDSPHFFFFSRLVVLADLYTNYCSIILSYNYFNAWYLRLCSCLHLQCAVCWNHCTGETVSDQQLRMELKVMMDESRVGSVTRDSMATTTSV